jgi:protein Mpv17
MSAILAPSLPGRIWNRYITALREKPIRTRMISSGVLYVVGDMTAQFGIEDKSWRGVDGEPEGRYDVSVFWPV